MINKLRKKIFWIIQTSLSIVLIGVIAIFLFMSYKNTISSSKMFMDRIGGRQEIRENEPKEFRNMPNNDMDFELNIDGVYKIEIENNQITRKTDGATNEIIEYAKKIENKQTKEGLIGDYTYEIKVFGNNSKEITFVENKETIGRLKLIYIFSGIIGLLGIICISIIAKKIAKTIVKPVEKSFEKQKQFVSDASHELKTPLAVIEANADVLQGEVGENKWIGYIQNEVQSMNKLVNDLLTLAKMENTNRINYQKFDLSKEIQMSVAVFESMIYEKEIKLESNIDEGISFNGDKEDIKHIISIILDNAIKHTEKEGKIIVNALKEKNDIKIEIKNQGEPIPEEEREKIFERFYRVDKARNRNEKRYGLGLAIAKEIVEKYNGTIKANSKDGFTSFVVKICNK